VGQAIRSLLTLDDPESEFLQTELKDLHGQLKSLDESIRQIETRPATEADLEAVTSALQRLDPIWEVLYPEEQRRVLELLVDEIDVGKTAVTVQFRADGIEQIVTELEPIGERWWTSKHSMRNTRDAWCTGKAIGSLSESQCSFAGATGAR
jgi:hypothetical protein